MLAFSHPQLYYMGFVLCALCCRGVNYRCVKLSLLQQDVCACCMSSLRNVYSVQFNYILHSYANGSSNNKKSQSNWRRAASPPPKPPLPLGHVEHTHPSTDRPTHHPKRHSNPISRFATVHPADRPTDRPTDGEIDRHMGLATCLHQDPFTLIVSDAAKN